MSITINDILELPSMVNAEVVAGHGGLKKVISSVSVLESINYEIINDYAYKEDEVGGTEIVITGFLNAVNDKESQLNLIKQLADSGEAGIIWYYVGIYVNDISEEIIEYANGNDFVIICMPRNQKFLRYSDAISDIMTAIVHDKDQNKNIVVSLLDTIARLPAKRQNVGTMIKLVSEHLHCSVILLSQEGKPLHEAAWPGEYAGIHQYINIDELKSYKEKSYPFDAVPNSYIHRKKIYSEFDEYELIFISIGTPVPNEMIEQVSDAICISINIWDQKREGAVISELVKAILRDEPLKMRSLASIFQINISSIHNMWIIHGKDMALADAKALADYASMYCKTSFADIYEKKIVLFMSEPERNADMKHIYEAAKDILPDDVKMSLFMNLDNTKEVRDAFLLNETEIEDAGKILPDKKYYTASDLNFASECRKVILSGETAVEKALSVLHAFEGLRDYQSMVETLSCYLLDADCGLIHTSEKMYVHKNTIKYRLKTMSECIGFTIGVMPASYDLYKAVSIKRLLSS